MIRLTAHPGGARLAGRRSAQRKFAMIAAAALLSLPVSQAFAQKQVPPAPMPTAPAPTAKPSPATPAPATKPGTSSAVPTAPAPSAVGKPMFPKVSPKNFTATTPTKATVNAFLRASWGYDTNRVWEVAAILKTQVQGVSKVVVFVGDKKGKQKPAAISFFTLPGGKHIIAGDQVVNFGANPFAAFRTELQQRANGPYQGSASKNLEMVEFADFECPHCKEAEPNMEKLAKDFPQARIVFQFYPLTSIHPEAKLAAEYGVCVAKLGGNSAFFKFAPAVFQAQQGLATADGATMTLNSAVIKAGLKPKTVAACVKQPSTSADVDASVKLAQDLNIYQTPMLVINGREVPGNVPYPTLKKIVEYQAKLDGIMLETPPAGTGQGASAKTPAPMPKASPSAVKQTADSAKALAKAAKSSSTDGK